KLRPTRLFYRGTWKTWSAIARRMQTGKLRETYLSVYGPLSMLALLVFWAIGLIFSFAMLQWSLGSSLQAPEQHAGFATDLYMSGTTFCTLGLGDVTPRSPMSRLVTAAEGCTGFGFLAIVIGYLPVIYQAFSRREVHISLLDARAGSPSTPVELLRRYGKHNSVDALAQVLLEWERWSAELLESHI